MSARESLLQARDGVVLEKPHNADCWFVDEPEKAFVVYDGMVARSHEGSPRGHLASWHKFVCNDPGCPAVVVVRWDVMAAMLAEALRGT